MIPKIKVKQVRGSQSHIAAVALVGRWADWIPRSANSGAESCFYFIHYGYSVYYSGLMLCKYLSRHYLLGSFSDPECNKT